LNKILHKTLAILDKEEKKKIWQLAIEDVFTSILDIFFLIVLLFLVRFYTEPPASQNFHRFQEGREILNSHPILFLFLFLLLFAVKNLLGFLVSKQQYEFAYRVASRISKNALRSFLDSSYADYVHIDSSVINRRISQQPVEFSHFVLNGFQQIFTQLVLIVLTIAAITLYNPILFPFLLLIMIPPVLFIGVFIKKKMNISRQLGKQTSEKSMQFLQEALTGFIESNTYGKNNFFTDRYDRFQSRLNKYLADRIVIQNMPSRMIEVFAVFGLFVLVALNYIISGDSTVRLVTVGALMISAYKIIPGIVKIINTAGQIKTYSFTTEGLTAEAEKSNPLQMVTGIETLEFKNVFFNYGDRKILKNFSVFLTRGEMLGISGLSGRGKTTFINLLLGFLEPGSGSIWLNGKPAGPAERKAAWSRIAYVKQQPFLLHASIAENITFQETGYDEQKLWKILNLTGLQTTIDSFPQGLQTIVTENGKNFSGGQRQRIVFARSLYKDADVLILDEPFNELDSSSENDMLLCLQNMVSEGKIVLLITHNHAAIEYCNKKYLLDEA